MKTYFYPLLVCMFVPAQLFAQVNVVEQTANISTPLPVKPQSLLPAGTTVIVSMDDNISSISAKVGDEFGVTVVKDVMYENDIVVPKGTTGIGVLTFVTKKGGFGKPGIVAIALRHLDINGGRIALEGRYREEGCNNNGAAAATMFAVGVAAILINGKTSIIPKGRDLKARTSEDYPYTGKSSAGISTPGA